MPLLWIVFSFLSLTKISAQQINSPERYLGYELGSDFTYQYQVHSYFKHLESNSNNIKLVPYGSSYEGRPLFVAIIGSPKNLERLEAIRNSNLTKAGIVNGQELDDQPAVIWLSYNIHGNEAASTETSMKTAYELLTNSLYSRFMDNTLVIIDPCLNPDGHTRYVQFYKERVGKRKDIMPFTREHMEPWPGGRSNHYYFDLNRDWAWQTQKETKERIVLMNQWLPHVHVDFHEMGIDNPYFFSPASEPMHEDVSQWQKEFQLNVGKHLSSAFDQRNWLYFTAEIFDLFYPSYGDTYPTFNGAIGMTYEQGGSGRAGLAVLDSNRDTLTLKDRIEHHHIAGIYTVEKTHLEAKRLNQEFKQYFHQAQNKPKGNIKSYIIKNIHPKTRHELEGFLNLNGIKYGYGATNLNINKLNVFNYQMRKDTTIQVQSTDMVISAFQPKSTLLKVLFEPFTHLPDSNTYDITAWAIPYAKGLEAYAGNSVLTPGKQQEVEFVQGLPRDGLNALKLDWTHISASKFLNAALNAGFNARVNDQKITIDNVIIPLGSILFIKSDNPKLEDLYSLANRHEINLVSFNKSFPDSGPSFGSSRVRRIEKPKVGLVCGNGFNSSEIGEIWHLMDREIDCSIHLFDKEFLNSNTLNELNVLFITSFYDPTWLTESRISDINKWVQQGGRLVLIENAVKQFAQKELFSIKIKKEIKTDTIQKLEIRSYYDIERESIGMQNPGSIFKLELDNTHPLAYGYKNQFHILKTNTTIYEPLEDGHLIGIHKKGSHVSGFIGDQIKNHIESGMSIGIESIGKGHVIYFADNPIFRSFWDSGKLFFSNILYMIP
jgi:hypothetical protein